MLITFFSSTAIVSVLFFLAAFDVPHAQNIANQELQKYTLEPLTYLIIFTSGALLLSPVRYRGGLLNFIERNSNKVRFAYEAGAGSVLGWAIGGGAATILNDGLIMLPVVSVVCFLFLFVAMGPLWVTETSGNIIEKYRQFMFVEIKGKLAIQICGLALIVLSISGFVQWVKSG